MEFKDLLKNNLIDREIIILQNQKVINLSDKELIFIIKVLKFCNEDIFNFSDISKKSGTTKKETDVIIASLIKKNIISVRKGKDKELFFTMKPLWKKILLLFESPDASSPVEIKMKWIIETMEFEKNSLITNTLLEYINVSEWSKILNIVSLIQKNNLNNVSWSLFAKMLDDTKDEENSLKIKKILRENWLE